MAAVRCVAPMDGHDETTCSVRDVVNRADDKWSLTVIYELAWDRSS